MAGGDCRVKISESSLSRVRFLRIDCGTKKRYDVWSIHHLVRHAGTSGGQRMHYSSAKSTLLCAELIPTIPSTTGLLPVSLEAGTCRLPAEG
jgi:hypothetical protein